MKRIIIAFMAVVLLMISVVGCASNDSGGGEKTHTNGMIEDDSYKDIACVESQAYQNLSMSFGGSKVFRTSIPKEWKLVSLEKDSYKIMKGAKEIGTVTSDAEAYESLDFKSVFFEEKTYITVNVKNYIDRYGSDEDKSFCRRVIFEYKEDDTVRTLIFNIDYAEISDKTYERIFYCIELLDASRDAGLGILKVSDKVPSILILGNSFIGTSDIGSILETMCGAKARVNAISIGMATVGKTYSSNTNILSQIRSGDYSVVFMCGFYSPGDATELKTIIKACEEGGAKLAIFPAHNENRSAVLGAAGEYDYPVLVDWQAEINALIKSGVDFDSFCIRDTYNHSKPLAGYVGAHMIYRAVFGEIPPSQKRYSQVSSGEINSLGDYARTGKAPLIDTSSILYFN